MSTTTLVINCNDGDCWADQPGNFDNAGTELYIGESVNDAGRNPRTWFQFTVPLSQNQSIVAADLFVVANATSSADAANVSVSCENAVNPSAPANAADLNGRSVIGGQTVALPQFTGGSTYSFDVDTCIAAALALSGWVYNSNLAVIIDNVDCLKVHRARSSRHTGGAYRAYLQIEVLDLIPLGGVML